MNNKEEKLDLDYLKSILTYNPETGIFIWKFRDDFPNTWNNRYAGTQAGSQHNKSNYISILINGSLYSAHRLAYFIYYGTWPDKVDHENHVRNDNRILNLKEVTSIKNCHNRKKNKNNTSGINGVHFDKKEQKWKATICIFRKTKTLGRFKNIEDAIKSRREAELKHNFHKNHGK